MRTRIISLFAIIGMLSLGLAACSSLETETVSLKGYTKPNMEHVHTVDELFPDGDPIPFIILPMDGWTVGPAKSSSSERYSLMKKLGSTRTSRTTRNASGTMHISPARW